MNLTQLLSHLGCGDGSGNTSSTRVSLLLGVLTVLGTYVYVAVRTGIMPEVPASNLEFIGILAGMKALQNTTEKTPDAAAGTVAKV
jgi:hypothetical protein